MDFPLFSKRFSTLQFIQTLPQPFKLVLIEFT